MTKMGGRERPNICCFPHCAYQLPAKKEKITPRNVNRNGSAVFAPRKFYCSMKERERGQ